MKYYLIAGEASGDLHGSNLLRELKQQDTQAQFRGFGGDLMEQQGMGLVKHYRELSFMGLIEVIKNIRSISRNLSLAKQDLLHFKPDVLILIDYPGFNLRMAEFAKANGIKVIYYISPKLWAWKESRVKKIKAFVDLLLLILPFEKEFYLKHGYKQTVYVGNPVVDAVQAFVPETNFRQKHELSGKLIIALLPGSRIHELEHMLPVMLQVVPHFPDYEFVIAQAPGMDDEVYKRLLHGFPVKAVKAHTYDLLHVAQGALVTSGTATLETALFHVPQVVCYKISALTYAVGKRFVKISLYSLPNIIAGKEIIRELRQSELNLANLVTELKAALAGGTKHESITREYAKLDEILGKTCASELAAKKVRQYLSEGTF
ncbi:MAG: lipid-A-disaccharide synthase [Bacteroidia bacterium]|nr:lipid-A-disaccharide synthase [Bacteroidia bacterium]